MRAISVCFVLFSFSFCLFSLVFDGYNMSALSFSSMVALRAICIFNKNQIKKRFRITQTLSHATIRILANIRIFFLFWCRIMSCKAIEIWLSFFILSLFQQIKGVPKRMIAFCFSSYLSYSSVDFHKILYECTLKSLD